jgi:hypothetical protein
VTAAYTHVTPRSGSGASSFEGVLPLEAAAAWHGIGDRPRPRTAVELEALGQRRIVALVREALDDLLPEPLDDVLVREDRERAAVAALLDR